MSIFDGMFTGLVMGFISSLPAFISETIRHGKNLPIIVDVRDVRGRKLPEEEVLEWSVFLHLCLSVIFGGLYPALVLLGVFGSYAFSSLALYALIYYLFFGLAVFPAIGLGLFGRREGKTVWLELLAVSGLYTAGLWYAAIYFFGQ